jgi:hypothetical protein
MGIFDLFRRRHKGKAAPASTNHGIPTVKFDRSRVTKEVRKDVEDAIATLPEIPAQLRKWLFDIAIESISRGRDLFILADALRQSDIPDMDAAKAGDIAGFLNNRATALMRENERLKLGITGAKWLSPGAPCFRTIHGLEHLAQAHVEASGKIYEISKGLLIEGRPSWPGRDRGCICVSTSVIPGLDD